MKQVVSYFARHGETEGNEKKLFRSEDDELNHQGKKQMEKLAAIFKNKKLSSVYRSNRPRTAESAGIILKGRGIKPKVTDSLNPIDMGDFMGLKKTPERVKQVQEIHEQEHQPIPGGESLRQFRTRVDPGIMRAIHHGDDAGLPTLVVAHSSIIHQLSHLLTGDHRKVKVKPGGVVAVFKTPNGYEAKEIYREDKNKMDTSIGS